MIAHNFDYLSGTIRIKREAPPAWETEAVLPFWVAPNDPKWGSHLSRVLFHESIHFWQMLFSSYLVVVVSTAWEDLLHFEQSGEVRLENKIMENYRTAQQSFPFSAQELVECWARFWDVHTRGPHTIIQEEEILPPEEQKRIFLDQRGYTAFAYDTVMTEGPHCHIYGRPFRWLLQRVANHSLFAQLLFPILTHAAFTTIDPVFFFCRTVDMAIKSKRVRDVVNQFGGQGINLSWILCWDTIGREVIQPFITQIESKEERLIPFRTFGFQMIEAGPLRDHPIYCHYIKKSAPNNFLKWFHHFQALPYGQDTYNIEYANAINQTAKAMPMVAPFGMPGQPFYRSALGALVPPPKIQFSNFSWYAPVILEADISRGINHRAQDGKTFKEAYQEFGSRIQRYYYAVEATRLGLDPSELYKK